MRDFRSQATRDVKAAATDDRMLVLISGAFPFIVLVLPPHDHPHCRSRHGLLLAIAWIALLWHAVRNNLKSALSAQLFNHIENFCHVQSFVVYF